MAALLVILVGLAYASALRGEFVYDDTRQIVDNHLIQDPSQLDKALSSDVWAFKGDQPEAWSNYWRPLFVAWLAGNYALFGLGSTLPWHLGNLLLHLAVTLLGYALARRLGLGTWVAAAVAAIFAVHPAHVESVAWISGSPDLLAAIPLLGALLLLLPAKGSIRHEHRLYALALFALALLAKEMAILFPLAVGWAAQRPIPPGVALGVRLRAALRAMRPFLVVAAVYFAIRWWILGQVEVRVPWHHGPLELALTAPSLFAFYLRQALIPVSLGPSYPLRAVTLETLSATNFWLPLAVTLVFLAAALWLARRRPPLQLALGLFVLPLLPAFNLNAFLPEQLTHDRYLYLPLLGFWLLVLGAPALLAGERATPASDPQESQRGGRRRAELTVVALAALLVVPLGFATHRYSRAWTSEIALWERGVASDPTSAFNWAQYGSALLARGRQDEALAALDHALAIRPVTTAFLDRAWIATARGRLVDAEHDLKRVQQDQPDNPYPYQQLALVYQRQGRLPEAEAELRQGREAVPYRHCAMTSNLAVVLYLAGKKDEALRELVGIQPQVGSESNEACTLAAFHLGTLYRETGRPAEARAAFERYLAATARATDEATLARRRLVEQQLAGLKAGGGPSP